ncbi:serine/threonine protein phosphatase 1 [Bradyrhizobium sp. cir1]|uniref:metallophosphoesterase family protein n=1 Tax=Bradyrhizobium sp. cir1 TaxID=1445730 RepID=UPI0017B79815|nr:metallophosphoesterase family protein [Bradyrhizobium sp. cir1]MBB4371355.1 serine/threonine protein phosphatase 1 [Bradyrhizobium sp. cir1]
MTFAIGDIHGCFDELLTLLAVCDLACPEEDARFIFVGDYIDRGPDSGRVVDFLIRRQADQERRFICLRGNHEEMLVRAADRHRSDRDLMNWWGNGGEQTLESYGVDDPGDLPAEHLAWFRQLPLMHKDRHRLFVHAGIRPGVPLSLQSPEDLLWIREPFLSSADDHGLLVVHGHTPVTSGRPDLRANRLNLDTGACFGGPLTAAAFSSRRRAPVMFATSMGDLVRL